MQRVGRDQKKKKKKVMMPFKLMPSRQLGPKNNNTHLATCQENLHLVLFFQKNNTNKLLFSFRVLLCAGISGRDKRPAARWHSLDIFFCCLLSPQTPARKTYISCYFSIKLASFSSFFSLLPFSMCLFFPSFFVPRTCAAARRNNTRRRRPGSSKKGGGGYLTLVE